MAPRERRRMRLLERYLAWTERSNLAGVAPEPRARDGYPEPYRHWNDRALARADGDGATLRWRRDRAHCIQWARHRHRTPRRRADAGRRCVLRCWSRGSPAASSAEGRLNRAGCRPRRHTDDWSDERPNACGLESRPRHANLTMNLSYATSPWRFSWRYSQYREYSS